MFKSISLLLLFFSSLLIAKHDYNKNCVAFRYKPGTIVAGGSYGLIELIKNKKAFDNYTNVLTFNVEYELNSKKRRVATGFNDPYQIFESEKKIRGCNEQFELSDIDNADSTIFRLQIAEQSNSLSDAPPRNKFDQSVCLYRNLDQYFACHWKY